MTRQVISTGTLANDGTGDTLRSAGSKINANFTELYSSLGGDTLGTVSFEDSSITWEGNTPDLHETRLFVDEPTQDNSLYLPDVSGNIVVDSATQTLTNKTLTRPSIDSAQISRLEIKDIDSSHNYNIVPGALSSNITVTLPNLSADDEITFNKGTQTLENKRLYKPRIQQAIHDSNGEPLIEFAATGTNSNLKITNADNPVISTISSNANANVNIESKGTGSVIVKKLSVGASSTISSGGINAGSPYIADTNVTLIRNIKATDFFLKITDGTTAGEMKMVTNGTTGSGDVIIQFTSGAKFAQGTTLTLEPNGVAQFIWDGTKWYLVNYFDTYMTIA